MIVVALTSYLIGSIPFGLLISRAMGLGDIRNIGSGNIGATNVLRSGSKKAAAATLLSDALKGFIAALLPCYFLQGHFIGVAFVFAIIGHCFPIWLGFKGGKGVAVYIGALFGLALPLGIIGCLIWLATAWQSRISSASAIVMIASLPFVSCFLLDRGFFLALVIGGLIILFQHRANISRIINNTEPRIISKKI